MRRFSLSYAVTLCASSQFSIPTLFSYYYANVA